MYTSDYIIIAITSIAVGLISQSWSGVAFGILTGFLVCAGHNLLFKDD